MRTQVVRLAPARARRCVRWRPSSFLLTFIISHLDGEALTLLLVKILPTHRIKSLAHADLAGRGAAAKDRPAGAQLSGWGTGFNWASSGTEEC